VKTYRPTIAIACMLLSSLSASESARAQPAEAGAAKPQFILRVKPQYPPPAVERRLSGHVTVELTIAETGAVRDLVVVDSSDPVFEPPTLDAVRKWRYSPRDAGSRVRETLDFKVDAGDSGGTPRETIEFRSNEP
jgi:periplasmic protein TonB